MRTILFLFAFLFCFLTYGQQQAVIDSIKARILNSESDSAKATSQKSLGKYYRRNGEIGKAEEYALLSLETSLKSQTPEITAESYLLLGNIDYVKWKSSSALDHYQKVDSILSKNGIANKTLISALMNMGNIHIRLLPVNFDSIGYSKVKTYYLKSLDIAEKINDSLNQGLLYIRLGHCQKGITNEKDAIDFFLKAIPFIPENSSKIVDVYYALGSSYMDIGDAENAIYYMDKYFEKRKSTNLPNDLAIGNWSYGIHQYKLKNYRKAILHEKESAALFTQFENPNIGALASVYRTIADSYLELNDYQNAYDYRALEKKMTDSTRLLTQKNKLDELETKYQTEKKEQEITLLKTQNTLAAQQKKNQRNLLLGGIGLTSLIGVFLFLGYRNRKKTNDKLRELDQMKSSFFANISHEFRTPLSLIAGPIEEQLQKPDLNLREKQNLNTAQRNSKRLVTLVDQLLDLSKLESGHFKLKTQQGNLKAFIGQIANAFAYLAQKNNQDYSVTLDVEGDHQFDPDILEKVISNLISNALKYSPDGESIVVNASVANYRLALQVVNTGSSLTPSELENVFNRFYRSDEQTLGTGIGLALAKELVELHKGTITASGDLKEIAFTISLPISPDSFSPDEKVAGEVDFTCANVLTETEINQTEINIEKQEPVVSSKPILLIADDNEDLRNYVSSIFAPFYKLFTAGDGKEAFEIAKNKVPDLIITDLMMPKVDGIAFTKNCKTTEATSHIPVIMLTAKAGDENALIGLETGADAYITKPFNTEILKTTVHNLLENRRQLQERYSQELVLLPKDIAINSVDEQFLENLQHVMDTNLIESNFKTEDFAAAVGMSRMQLHRKLKALTGLSATEFIRSQRLKLAAQLLQKSDINVSQVGYSVGFNNHSYFTKCFKEHYGVSPSAYSKRHN